MLESSRLQTTLNHMDSNNEYQAFFNLKSDCELLALSIKQKVLTSAVSFLQPIFLLFFMEKSYLKMTPALLILLSLSQKGIAEAQESIAP